MSDSQSKDQGHYVGQTKDFTQWLTMDNIIQ